jgi:Uma2 family endonuclease
MAIVEIDEYSPPCDIAIPTDLPDSDGEPLETPWHRAAIRLLIEALVVHLRGRTDFFVGGNTFIYYNSAQWTTKPNALEFRGPDFFFVDGVDRTKKRRYWLVADEGGRYPDVIIELLSTTTAKVDRSTKKQIYQDTFKTAEYFLYDPDTKQLEGWRHDGFKYKPIQPNDKGFLYSEKLGLWLGLWVGSYLGEEATWLRF